ncbi:MAG TPA: hypothetical protein VG694_01395 [Candidatus Paceibacterota bacterium]|jgi:hypothetical protein|nr:hypothetical protein [Candidatus Paceibacterota bacterium]
MKNNFTETIITVCLVLVAVLLLNPFHFWMPNMMLVGMLALLLVLFGIFAGFILREKTFDERDSAHKTLAGRNAFLAGSFILMLGIAIEGYMHAVDPWLVIALVVMVLAKLFTRSWADKNR